MSEPAEDRRIEREDPSTDRDRVRRGRENRHRDREERRAQRSSRGGSRMVRRGGRDNVVACRLDDRALEALDSLVEAGVRGTRSDAAGWLITVGLQVNQPLLDEVASTVTEIKRLRSEAIEKASRFEGVGAATDPNPSDTTADTTEDADR